jgi:hypothetical protein
LAHGDVVRSQQEGAQDIFVAVNRSPPLENSIEPRRWIPVLFSLTDATSNAGEVVGAWPDADDMNAIRAAQAIFRPIRTSFLDGDV